MNRFIEQLVSHDIKKAFISERRSEVERSKSEAGESLTKSQMSSRAAVRRCETEAKSGPS